MDISTYQIQHGLNIYASQLKSERLDTARRLIASTPPQDRVTLSAEGKQMQLLAQAVPPTSAQLSMRPQEEERASSAEEVPRRTADEEARPEDAARRPQNAGRR